MGGEERKAFQVGGDMICGELESGRGCWFQSPECSERPVFLMTLLYCEFLEGKEYGQSVSLAFGAEPGRDRCLENSHLNE